LQTRFVVFDGTVWKRITEYSSVTTAKWTPTKAGTYQVCAQVKDATGKMVEQRKTYVINPTITINSYTASAQSPQTAGNTISLSATATGGTGALQTRFVVFDGTTWTRISEYSSATTAKWTPTKAGTYQVCTQVKDATGKMVELSKTYVINPTITINSFTSSVPSPQTVGNKITLNANATGGTGSLQTRYSAFDGTKWTMIKDYSTATTAVWTPIKTGTYQVWIDVKDATGKVVSMKKIYSII
jgi:alpha-amylase